MVTLSSWSDIRGRRLPGRVGQVWTDWPSSRNTYCNGILDGLDGLDGSLFFYSKEVDVEGETEREMITSERLHSVSIVLAERMLDSPPQRRSLKVTG